MQILNLPYENEPFSSEESSKIKNLKKCRFVQAQHKENKEPSHMVWLDCLATCNLS